MEKPGGYAADGTVVRSYLSTLRSLRAVDFPDDNATDLSTYGLDQPRLAVTLWVGKDADQRQLLLGKENDKKEIFVKLGGYTPMEAIVAATRDNAYAVGLEGQVGEVAPGKLADIIVLRKDPLADITVLQGGKHLSWVIKDGRIIDLDPRDEALTFQQAAE
jgi:hypothetical protein